MKVLVVAPFDGRGGISTVVKLHQRCAVWASMGCELVSTWDDRSFAHKATAAFRAYAATLLKIRSVDLVHVHLAGERSLLRKLPIIVLGKLLGKGVIVHVHAFGEQSLFEKTPFHAERLAFRCADRVVALSGSWGQVLAKYIPPRKIVVIPNPVGRPTAPASPTRYSGPRILFAGKLEPRKGYPELLIAAARVLETYPSAQFYLAGHGEVEAARQQARSLNIENSVHLLGWVDAEGLAQLYREADIFCLPSHEEGLPMSVLEAMSHALPVVCTPVGGLPELIEEGYDGVFARAGHPETIAEKLLELLRDPARAAKIGQNAAVTVEARCGLGAVSSHLERMYLEVFEDRRGASGVERRATAPVEVRDRGLQSQREEEHVL